MTQNKKLLKTILLLLSLPFLVLAVKTIIELRKGATAVPANLRVDTTAPQGPIPSSLWRNLSQGGEEPTDMIAPIIGLTKALQPQLIRIDHIFDFYRVYQGPNNFDFSALDKIINTILATGARPLLSLSYADTAFALGPEWSALVTATVRRYSQEKNISGIYYEVWNEPDLFGGWHYAKHPSYSTLYTQTAKAVVAGAPARNYKIGGPAITGYYSNWIKALFRLAAAHHLPLDFISWHRYSKIPQDYDRDFDSLNKILSDYPQYFDIERLVTEIGPNSEPDPWYDNRNSGIHLISLATRLSGKVHRLFTFEIIDGPNPRSSNSTGWGLITHDLKPKPRYFALQFLNQLKGQRLASSGDGSWVTSLSAKNGTAIQILLVNYDPRAAHHETVPVSLFNLTPGRYQLSTSTYLGHSSTRQITISAPIYRFDYYLDPNAAVLFEFKPI